MDLSPNLQDRANGVQVSPRPLILKSDQGIGLFATDRLQTSPTVTPPVLIRPHRALDLFVPDQEVADPSDNPKAVDVFAVANGVVVQVVKDYVTVHHEPYEVGWLARYTHINQLVVRGQPVLSGERIGTTGALDKKGNPIDHLHFGVWQTFNDDLLDRYLAIYRGPAPTNAYDLSTVSSSPSYAASGNLGDTRNSIALDPTLALYEWEEKIYPNNAAAWENHRLDWVKLASFQEVWRDRMRFVRVTTENRALYVPAMFGRPHDVSLIETLRQAFFSQHEVRLVWRDSLFFSQIVSEDFAPIVVDVAVRA